MTRYNAGMTYVNVANWADETTATPIADLQAIRRFARSARPSPWDRGISAYVAGHLLGRRTLPVVPAWVTDPLLASDWVVGLRARTHRRAGRKMRRRARR